MRKNLDRQEFLDRNVNGQDVFLRFLGGVIILAIIYGFEVSPNFFNLSFIVACYFIITGIVEYCPLYHLIGRRTFPTSPNSKMKFYR